MGVKYYRGIVQGSDEWFALRREVPTASCASKVITKTGKLAAAREGYMHQLFAEAICPEYAEDGVSNAATDWGHQWEPIAREAFAKDKGVEVDEVAFALAEDGRSGCSPDGLVLVDGSPVAGLEIKCPFKPAVHVATLAAGEMPAEHAPQVHWSMAVTGLDQWHFWSYFPGIVPFHQVVQRDDYTEKVAEAIKQFGSEYAEFRAMMKEKTRKEKAA